MNDNLKLSLEEKKRRFAELLAEKRRAGSPPPVDDYRERTYDMFLAGAGRDPLEAAHFTQWVDEARRDGVYAFEAPRLNGARTEVLIERGEDAPLHALNFASYNYLGYSHHPGVIAAAKAALDRYGLGAASSPVISGTMGCHRELEDELLRFFRLPDRGVSLFSSGYAVNSGTISAFLKPGGYVVMDRSAHASILEGAQLSRGTLLYFRHNDPEHLDAVLSSIPDRRARVLVCFEGVYSADGDWARLRELVAVARRHGAHTLVDEAHSILVAGPTGRGAAEEHGVLDEVDLLVLTFSKAFAGVGGALVAPKHITRYVNWYARCRMFSCALDPAVTAGMTEVLRLAAADDGQARRDRIRRNAARLRAALTGKVDLGVSESWIVTVYYGHERLTLPLNDHLQRHGLDTSILQFPAVPKGEARIRLFVSSEHTSEQIDRAAAIVLEAAQRFGFARRGKEPGQ